MLCHQNRLNRNYKTKNRRLSSLTSNDKIIEMAHERTDKRPNTPVEKIVSAKFSHSDGFSIISFMQEVVWFDVQDAVLTGSTVRRFLKLAASCDDTNSRWLCSLFDGRDVASRIQAKQVFLENGGDDPRALCFAALMLRPFDEQLLRRSASRGFAFAQALLLKARFIQRGAEERLEMALKAAEQNEREGLRELARIWIERGNAEKAMPLLLAAAELGCVDAMVSLFFLSFGKTMLKKRGKRLILLNLSSLLSKRLGWVAQLEKEEATENIYRF